MILGRGHTSHSFLCSLLLHYYASIASSCHSKAACRLQLGADMEIADGCGVWLVHIRTFPTYLHLNWRRKGNSTETIIRSSVSRYFHPSQHIRMVFPENPIHAPNEPTVHRNCPSPSLTPTQRGCSKHLRLEHLGMGGTGIASVIASSPD